MIDFRGYPDFAAASQAVLKLLQQRIDFDLWMVTRVAGDDWIVLQAEDKSYGVEPGKVFNWADSFCSEMVKGKGPCIAPQSDVIEVYKHAPINQQVKIAAYIGMPLCDRNGNLFGTLCGIHPEAFPNDLDAELPLIEVIARLLSSLLDAELNAQNARRRAERAEIEAQTDVLTGLYNRRGWNQLLHLEELRCQQFGYPASVIVVDLDNFKKINDEFGHTIGDEYLQRFADVVRPMLRKEDIAARIGGDEFAILGVEMDGHGVQVLVKRLNVAFASSKIEASLGIAVRNPGEGLIAAWQQADLAMYRQKRDRKLAVEAAANPLPSPEIQR